VTFGRLTLSFPRRDADRRSGGPRRGAEFEGEYVITLDRTVRVLVAVGASALFLSATVSAATAEARSRTDGPRLVAPSRAVLASSAVRFRWARLGSARTYELRLSRSARFAGVESFRVRGLRTRLLLARGTWHWRVRALGHPASRWSVARRFRIRPVRDILPPTRPGAIRVGATTDSTVAVRFGAASDEFGVSAYRVLGNGHVLTVSARTAVTIHDLPCATTYTFAAVAVDLAGNRSRRSPVAHARTRPCLDALPPTAAGPLQAANVTDRSVALSWAPATDPDGSVAGYAVTRDGIQLGRPAANGFVATHLAANRTYVFAVRAIDRAGHGSTDAVSASVRTLLPVQATGPVHAFLLASTGASFLDLQRHYSQISVVYPTYFSVDVDGTLLGRNDPLVTSWAEQHGVRVLARVETQDPVRIHALLSDPDRRAALVSTVARQAAADGFDGISIDFEAGAATDRPFLTAFVQALATALHGQGQTLSVCVSPTTRPTLVGRPGFFDYAALAQAADELFVLAWDQHWSTSPAGPLASIGWVSQIVSYLDTLGQTAKLTIGAQLYGMDWPLGGRGVPLEFDDLQGLIAAVGAGPAMEPLALEPTFAYTDATGVPHAVWYANAESVSARLALFRARGYRIGVWRLGDEDQSLWAQPSVAP
jgi:spore germination protein YaaH/chitodextrinase